MTAVIANQTCLTDTTPVTTAAEPTLFSFDFVGAVWVYTVIDAMTIIKPAVVPLIVTTVFTYPVLFVVFPIMFWLDHFYVIMRSPASRTEEVICNFSMRIA